jgi:hypothetical protein
MNSRIVSALVALALGASASVGAAPTRTTASPLILAQTAPEPKTAGDIPDNQAFVRYTNPSGGYSLEIPEGWARTVNGEAVSFDSKLGSVTITVGKSAQAPTVASVRQTEVKALERQAGVVVRAVSAVKLAAGNAVLVRFDSQSKPNAVTGQSAALENDLYLIYKGGRQVSLTLSAAKGADNVDAWKRVAGSFGWR